MVERLILEADAAILAELPATSPEFDEYLSVTAQRIRATVIVGLPGRWPDLFRLPQWRQVG